MNPRELILLSPYRLPAQNSVSLGHDDVAAFLNGHAALWHPAVLTGAVGPPKIASSYDYEQPKAGHVYALPESPPSLLPDDWHQRVTDAGAIAFRATADRAATFANLRAELDAFATRTQTEPVAPPFGVWPGDASRVGPFLGLGFGYLVLNALFEAMEHENMIPVNEFWQDMQTAAAALDNPEAEAFLTPLRAAAGRLRYGREVLYPSPIYVIDLVLPDEKQLADPFPAAFAQGLPINVLASAALLERLGREHPERLAVLKERFQKDEVEICSGGYLEREDALLPPESQLWNLEHGRKAFQEMFGAEPRVFGRKRFAGSPQQPMFLTHNGLAKMVNLAFDNGVLPSYRTAITSWPAPSGKSVDAFTRPPLAADNPLTFFTLAHHIYKTVRNESTATIALLHKGGKSAVGYEDWLELTRFGEILGRWTPLSRYFGEAVPGEYASAAPADDFHSDYLEERTIAKSPQPVGEFAEHLRRRRRLDTAWTLAALYRGLAGKGDALRIDDRLPALETALEIGPNPKAESELAELQAKVGRSLADRLVAGATGTQPGFLALNPCSFTRRVALEVEGITKPLPPGGPIKFCQIDGNVARLVLEIPPLGFAWFPQSPTTPAPAAGKSKAADNSGVRNEFFEAEVDPLTGGLKAFRDLKTKANRLGQQLVFNPGGKMRVREIKVTANGPALGEVVTIGSVLGDQEQVLANYRQRFRAWAGRPVLDLQIELTPVQPPAGYPWHAYYAARFAWGDDRTLLLRGVNGTTTPTAQTRPETPEFLDLRSGKMSTSIFPNGLPFHQKQGTRMLDVILAPEGETTQTFDLALGLDRELPALTALGLATPTPVVPTAKGPPHVGAVGWLFHLDALNLLMTHLKPLPDGADGVTLRVLECSTHGGAAEFRCVRDPKRAMLTDGRGNTTYEAGVSGDAVVFEAGPSDLVQLRIEFS